MVVGLQIEMSIYTKQNTSVVRPLTRWSDDLMMTCSRSRERDACGAGPVCYASLGEAYVVFQLI